MKNTFDDTYGEVKVLLLSDCSQSLQNIEATLKQLNYHVSAFTNCEQGIAALRAMPDMYSLIIIDLQEKNEKSIEMVKMIRMMEDLLKKYGVLFY